MIVTAWKSSKHNKTGAGYGLKVTLKDRDRYFKREWKSAVLYLADPDVAVEVNVDKPSFWNTTCHELICKDIGVWLLGNGFAPWPKGKPPKFVLKLVSPKCFRLSTFETE